MTGKPSWPACGLTTHSVDRTWKQANLLSCPRKLERIITDLYVIIQTNVSQSLNDFNDIMKTLFSFDRTDEHGI